MPRLQSQRPHLSTGTAPCGTSTIPEGSLPPLCCAVVRAHSLLSGHLGLFLIPFQGVTKVPVGDLIPKGMTFMQKSEWTTQAPKSSSTSWRSPSSPSDSGGGRREPSWHSGPTWCYTSLCHTRTLRLREFVTSTWKRWDLHSHLTTSPGLSLPFKLHKPLRAGGGGVSEDGRGLELGQDHA